MAEPAADRAAPPPSRRGRQLGVVVLLAVAGAALAAVSAALTWWSADYRDPLTGALTLSLSGADCVLELIPLALVGLAGLGAALATRGRPRRLVGVVLALAGGTIAVRSALSFGDPPAALVRSLTRPADPVGAARLHPLGPILALLAGLLLAAAGVLVVLGKGARQRLGDRYDAPSRAAAGAAATGPAGDREIGDWWKALDGGADPTVHPAPAGEPAEAPAGGMNTAAGSTGPPAVSEPRSGGGYHDPNASRPT